jgi:hypothetical protein
MGAALTYARRYVRISLMVSGDFGAS